MRAGEELVIAHVSKRMGAVQALRDVSLTIPAASVHGIIGHNGSGKSTLVKVLSGALHLDGGSLSVRAAVGPAPEERRPRVATVFQDLGLADNLTVFENVLANGYATSRFGVFSMRRERSRAVAILEAVGLDVSIDLEARELSEPERVMLCVGRALFRAGLSLAAQASPGRDALQLNSDIDALVLDEPTSALPREDLLRFRELLARLREQSKMAILIVTHNPSDVETMCDAYTALRNGEVIHTATTADGSGAQIAALMAGAALDGAHASAPAGDAAEADGDTCVEVPGQTPAMAAFTAQGIETAGLSRPASLEVKAGEFVGLTGLEGSGFREFLRAGMGVQRRRGGTVTLNGKLFRGGPHNLARLGAIYVPADRARESAIPEATVYENMTLGRIDAFCTRGVIRRGQERARVTAMLEQLRIEPADPNRVLTQMSGGQQQKVVIGRALLSGAAVLALEEPTAAVDVGAQQEIRGYLHDRCADGGTVLVASGEMDWLARSCSRVVVFWRGGIVADFSGEDLDEQRIWGSVYGG